MKDRPDQPSLTITAQAPIETRFGRFQMETFRYQAFRHESFHNSNFRDGHPAEPHVALRLDFAQGVDPLVRIHSECLTGDVFGSARCDCGSQLDAAMRRIGEHGSGVLIYLRQEGRGIGIENKLRAYQLQERGFDTVDANLQLGLPIDARSYDAAAAFLTHHNIHRCLLLTNNPDKLAALRDHRIDVTRSALITDDQASCRHYLETKRVRMGHIGE